MRQSILPHQDGPLVQWAANFAARLEADPQLYHVSPEQLATVIARTQAYVAAYKRANAPATRGPSSVMAKNLAKQALCETIRPIAHWCKAMPTLSAEQKLDLGFRLRKSWTRVNKPTTAPRVQVRELAGNRVRCDLADPGASHVRLPDGVSGAIVWVWYGDAPPSDVRQWIWAGETSRARTALTLHHQMQPGDEVWFCACWRNYRHQTGPTSTPIRAYASYGLAMQKAA